MWTLSLAVDVIFTSSVRTLIDFLYLFWFNNPLMFTSSVRISIDFSCLFSLKFILRVGSVKLVEPSALFGLSCVCKAALFILGLNRVSFLISY